MKHVSLTLLATWAVLLFPATSLAAEKVTVDNYVRAETDATMARYVSGGALGKFLHIREPTPIDQQNVIRMNRDTLYSVGVFDLSQPVTIIKPDSGGRFQSMQVIDEDHYTHAVEYGPGEFTFTKDQIGTRYLVVLFRTFIDASDEADIKAANALQDKIQVRSAGPGSFEVPDWDAASMTTIRDALNVLAASATSTKHMFGSKAEVDPIHHLLGAAFGWGGNPRSAAIYVNVVPEKNDGKTPYLLKVSHKVPVDGFVSITVYNAKGFMEKNDLNAYSINNVTAKKDPDGTVTVHFGGDPTAINYLPITPGWNYTVRLYRPQKVILDGSWTFPAPTPVE